MAHSQEDSSKIAIQKRFDECFQACLKAYPKPTNPVDLAKEKDQLVDFLISEKCVHEEERDDLLKHTFEALRNRLCGCQCNQAAEVLDDVDDESDSTDSTGGVVAAGLNLTPPKQGAK